MTRNVPLEEDENLCTVELKRKWNNRVRHDREVCGAIELSFLRGYQSGYEDARDGKRPLHYINPPKRTKRKA